MITTIIITTMVIAIRVYNKVIRRHRIVVELMYFNNIVAKTAENENYLIISV